MPLLAELEGPTEAEAETGRCVGAGDCRRCCSPNSEGPLYRTSIGIGSGSRGDEREVFLIQSLVGIAGQQCSATQCSAAEAGGSKGKHVA